MDALLSLGNKHNIIESWLKPLEENYSHQRMMVREKMGELFKNITVTIP